MNDPIEIRAMFILIAEWHDAPGAVVLGAYQTEELATIDTARFALVCDGRKLSVHKAPCYATAGYLTP